MDIRDYCASKPRDIGVDVQGGGRAHRQCVLGLAGGITRSPQMVTSMGEILSSIARGCHGLV
jgi:hypothetical protein